jgi:nucleotide-binding universal stress UspA family protein
VGAYQTVIVGTDGSESATRAVARAAAVAKDAGATLVIVTAYHPMSKREQEQARDALGQESYKVTGSAPAEGVLQEAADRAREIGVTKVETDAAEGDPVDVLIDKVAEYKADLIIIGNRGLNSLAGRLLGSVPANVSHRAAIDVLIVHTTA